MNPKIPPDGGIFLCVAYSYFRVILLGVLCMMIFLMAMLGCLSDQMLVHEVEKEVEVIVEVPGECVTEEIIVEDTAFDFSDIWVDSFRQVATLDGVDIFWVIDPSGSMNDDQEQIMAGITHMMANLPEIGWRLMIIPCLLYTSPSPRDS